MRELGQWLSYADRQKYVDQNLRPGCILYLKVDFTRPPKPKYVVYLGDSGSASVLVFVVNSRVTPFKQCDTHLRSCHVVLKVADCPFLDHDSYIDCTEVIAMGRQHVLNELISDVTAIKGRLPETTRAAVVAAAGAAQTVASLHKDFVRAALA